MKEVTCWTCGIVFEFNNDEKIPMKAGKFYCMDCLERKKAKE